MRDNKTFFTAIHTINSQFYPNRERLSSISHEFRLGAQCHQKHRPRDQNVVARGALRWDCLASFRIQNAERSLPGGGRDPRTTQQRKDIKKPVERALNDGRESIQGHSPRAVIIS